MLNRSAIMHFDRFPALLEGSRIVIRYTEARQCARALCRWLADTMNASAVGIRFTDKDKTYHWEERVGRIVPGAGTTPWTRPFPDGRSSWIFDGGQTMAEPLAPVLDTIAQQWLTRNWSGSAERTRLQPLISRGRPNPAWVAVSRRSRIVQSRLPHLSHSLRPLLLIGETGSGKHYLARLIHRSSPDPSAPFRGPDNPSHSSAPGELGTLYITGWNLLDQKARTRILDNARRENRRLIAALTPPQSDEQTAPPTETIEETIEKTWTLQTDQDSLIMHIPALRERIEDIPLLAGHFLNKASAAAGRRTPEISPTAVEALRCYPWPGNIRELEETIFLALDTLPIENSRLSIGDLPPAVRGALARPAEPSFPERLVALEYEALKEELRRQRGNMTRTARALGLTPRQVSWRLKKYGINPRDFKPAHYPIAG